MSSPSPEHISIRLEVHIPTQGGARPVLIQHPPAAVVQARLFGNVTSSSPQSNSTCPVRQMGGSGSGTGIGTICGWVTYSTAQADVFALASPTSSYVPSATPGASAVRGIPDASQSLWTWSAGNEIPGACYSAAGVADTLAVWSRPTAGSGSGSSWVLDEIPFTGIPGTTGPCGTGSGAVMIATAAATKVTTYPALWCVVIAGFHADPLRALNAIWALRQVADSPSPTWDNAGDGIHVGHIRLRLCNTRGWELTLTHGAVALTYAIPFGGSAFGPLLFPAQQTNVPPVGLVNLPPITVSAV
ncbi:MAG: hypothetical protein JWO38_5316 [Gemmataceae bacterium]|nr:hypothetical protein [Gemmataceae bacterium]